MSEAQMPRVDVESGSSSGSQETQQWSSSDFYDTQDYEVESGKNSVLDKLKSDVDDYYWKGNPKILREVENRMGIIREIVAKNGRNSEEELLWIQELIVWAGELQDKNERIIRAYSICLYLEEEIDRIPDELRKSKKDYIIFLKRRIGGILDVVVPPQQTDKPTRLQKILPTVRRYALAVTSVVALWSLWYARHLKSENNDIQGDYTQTSSLLENERQTNSDLEREVQRLEKEKKSIDKENWKYLDALSSKTSQLDKLYIQLANRDLGLIKKSDEYQRDLGAISDEYNQRFVDLKAENTRIRDNSEFAINKILEQIDGHPEDIWESYRRLLTLKWDIESPRFFTKADAIRFAINPDDETIKLNTENEMGIYKDPRELRKILKTSFVRWEWLRVDKQN